MNRTDRYPDLDVAGRARSAPALKLHPWHEIRLARLAITGGQGRASRFMSDIRESDLIDFGETPTQVNELLQQGVLLNRQNRTAADAKFRDALALDPSALATYFCLYKIHAYQGELGEALAIAEAGLAEAERQAGLSADWAAWTPEDLVSAPPGPARFALYTLKAIAFIQLRRGHADDTRRRLDKLAELGAIDGIGGGVVADLARAVA